MSSADEFHVQNIYKYSRKTYKKSRKSGDDCSSPREDCTASTATDHLAPACSCDPETEGDIAHILHKKCPVITLAQQQLQKLVEGTDKLMCEHSEGCKSVRDFVCICRGMIKKTNKVELALICTIALAFSVGILLGSASCGAYLGRFNSPILNCIDNFFMSDSYGSIRDSFHSIS